MAVLLSRTIGGMRAGDLRALDWAYSFEDGFRRCRVPREKTNKPQLLEVPEQVQRALEAWHQASGSPAGGPVFPVRTGKRAGQRKKQNNSWAPRLRKNLKLALGVARFIDGWFVEKDEALYTARERELFLETSTTLPIDFHSCRRAFATAMARSNVNVQTAQILAGHSDPRIHQRYVEAATIRALPEAAMLQIEGPIMGVCAHSVHIAPKS